MTKDEIEDQACGAVRMAAEVAHPGLNAALRKAYDAGKKAGAAEALSEVFGIIDAPDFGEDHTGVVNWLIGFAARKRAT